MWKREGASTVPGPRAALWLTYLPECQLLEVRELARGLEASKDNSIIHPSH